MPSSTRRVCREMRRLTRKFGLMALVALVALPVRAWAADDGFVPPSLEAEERAGQQASREIEAQYQLVDDQAQIARLNQIAASVAPLTERPEVKYSTKILKADEVNAFSLPGGRLYVTTGFLAFAKDDSEVAGVLAHEIAHNCHYHVFRELARQERAEQRGLLAVLLSALSGNPEMVATAWLGMRLYTIAVTNSYSVDLEGEADRVAVGYLLGSSYSPLGLPRFLERLGRQISITGEELGYLQTHPDPTPRVAAIYRMLLDAGIEVSEPVLGQAYVVTATVNGQQVGEVRMADVPVFRPADLPSGYPSHERALAVADALNDLIKRDVRIYEVYPSAAQNGDWVLMARGNVVLEVTAQDAALADSTPELLAGLTKDALRLAFHRATLTPPTPPTPPPAGQ